MSLKNPQSGNVSGVNGGVEIIKQSPPKIDNGIATTIPSRIAAKCLWFPSLVAIGTKVRLASSLNLSMKFIYISPFLPTSIVILLTKFIKFPNL